MFCPHCKKEFRQQDRVPLRDIDPEEYKRRKTANAYATQKKCVERGTKRGRPTKRNDEMIWALRDKGLSLREIALQCRVSTAAVQRSLQVRKVIR